MPSYLRYHPASGHIDTKIVVSSEDLPTYAKAGHSFLVSDAPFGTTYIDADKSVKSRIDLKGGVIRRAATTGETVTFTALPTDCWYSIDCDTPMRSVNGIVTVSPKESEAHVEIVGKYMNVVFQVTWENLADLRERAKVIVDTRAEEARTRVITSGSGQAMTYLRKADAARAFLSGATLSDAQMLRIQEEASRLNISLNDAATAIVGMAEQWEVIDATIDGNRLIGKAAIDGATSGAAIQKILREIVWPV